MILTGRRERGIEALDPWLASHSCDVCKMIRLCNKQTLIIGAVNAQKGSGHFHIQRSLRCV
jgi:hypothetical protein